MTQYAYITAAASPCGTGGCGFTIVDVENPASLISAARDAGTGPPKWMQGAHAVDVVDGYMYIVSIINDSLTIYNVDPTGFPNPPHQGAIEGAGPPNYLDNAKEVKVVGDYAFITTGGTDYSFTVIDISDKTNPVFSNRLTAPFSPYYLYGAEGLTIVDDKAYIASFSADAITIFDISTPTAISHLGAITDATKLNGARGIFVRESDKYAFVGAFYRNGLEIYDCSNPASISFVGELQGAGSPNYLNGARGVDVVGDYAYVAANADSSLTIVDISTPSAPSFVSSIAGGYGEEPWLTKPWSVRKIGDYAFLTSGANNCFTVINVSDPANPFYVNHIADTDGGTYLASARGLFVEEAAAEEEAYKSKVYHRIGLQMRRF